MKKLFLLFLIGVPFAVITYSLLSLLSTYIGFGPLDTFPRASKTISCQKDVEATVYRKKEILILLPTTDNRIEIKKDNRVVFDDRLSSTDFWLDIEPKDLTLECENNVIRTSAKRYFDNTYRIEANGEITKEKKFTW